jgi:uncharacterized membrane protein YccC
MIDYDPAVIQEFAEKLYAKARWSAVRLGLTGLLIGWGMAYVITLLTRVQGGTWVMVSALVCCFVGAQVGWARAFNLRFQAQSVLLQKRIEENTRAGKT